jgi:hypothetical protein
MARKTARPCMPRSAASLECDRVIEATSIWHEWSREGSL